MKLKKDMLERNLKDALRERRSLKPQIERAEALLESLNSAQEDNECVISDLSDCIKNGIYS
tara:strand:+ start:492 stop:674 length:183 start_codon:yes stop_codon:yes gene_type:complete